MVLFGQARAESPTSSCDGRTAARKSFRSMEPGWLYAFEIDAAGRAIRAGKTEFDPPGMTLADTLGNMKVLDKWRTSVGLEFEIERPRRSRTKIDGRALAKPALPMRRRKVQGLAAGGLGGRPRHRRIRELRATPPSFSTRSTSAAAISSTPPGSMPAARATSCSARGWRPAAYAGTWWCSARALTPRSPIPT